MGEHFKDKGSAAATTEPLDEPATGPPTEHLPEQSVANLQVGHKKKLAALQETDDG